MVYIWHTDNIVNRKLESVKHNEPQLRFQGAKRCFATTFYVDI